MAHLLIGDGHYRGAASEAVHLAALINRAREHDLREVSILGDLLELWIGLEGLEPPWQHRLFEPLFALRRDGVRLRYVVGNKDYFVERWNARHGLFDTVVQRACIVDSPLGPLHLAHGDLVNTADRPYRSWRAVSRSGPVSATMRLLPRPWLGRLSARVAERLERTNRYHKSYFPEAALRARAREQSVPPALMVYGHFHVHRELVEGPTRIVTLPFLGGDNAGLLLDGVGLSRIVA